MARSAQDLELVLRVIAGSDLQEWEVPPVPLTEAPERPLRALRLAWWDDFGGVLVSAATRAALGHLAEELARRGAYIERRSPDGFDFATAVEVARELFGVESGASMSPEQEVEVAARFGRTPGATVRRYVELLTQRDALSAQLERFLTEWDALLCPVSSGPAFPHCPPGTPILVDGQEVPYRDARGAYAQPFNLTGHPAVALPLARSAEGLPIGVQMVGRRWGEAELLAFARQLKVIIGPFQRPPGY